MPVIPSTFDPPRLLRGGHTQTVIAALLPRRINLSYERIRWELPDGDFLDLDWVRRGQPRVAIISHALEGCSANSCIRGMAATLADASWDILAWNFRGCGGEPNRLPRFYHSGDTDDLAAVIDHAASTYPQIALVGFSLGGNVTLKYLGQGHTHPAIVAAAGISVPVDIAASRRILDEHLPNRIYTRRLIKKVRAKAIAKARQFPAEIDITGVDLVKTFEQFDTRYTAPLHGFADAPAYWAAASSRPYLSCINIPTLILNARNDPFLAPECFPIAEAEANPYLALEMPVSGGHVGFLDFANGSQPYSERRTAEFLTMSMSAAPATPAPTESSTAMETASTSPLRVKSAMPK